MSKIGGTYWLSYSKIYGGIYLRLLEDDIFELEGPKPDFWIKYVDDIFICWAHGTQALDDFLKKINKLDSNIRFSLETKNEGRLPFLDVDILIKDQGLFHLQFIGNQSNKKLPFHFNLIIHLSLGFPLFPLLLDVLFCYALVHPFKQNLVSLERLQLITVSLLN